MFGLLKFLATEIRVCFWIQGVVSNGFCLLNPFFRCTKENRAAGILDNHAEGEKYKENFLRKFVRNKKPEIMPGLNKFFTDPTY
ncbi:putative NADH-ubiquinone reductase complex 1 MLRQ subunit [Arabidopsis thaliana]